MTPRLLIKLATAPKKSQGPVQKRFAGPLAILKANQLGLPQNNVLYDSMQNNLNRITMDLITGKISTTKQAGLTRQLLAPVAGAVDLFADWHKPMPKNDDKSRLEAVMNSGCMTGTGLDGYCDLWALAHTMSDKNAIKGQGETIMSMNRGQDINNIKNLGSMGRSGGTRLA